MAVYTPLTNEQIAEFLEAHYRVGALAFAVGITQGVENSNYLIGTQSTPGTEQKYILTLYEKRMNTAELPFFLGLMQHVAQHGVACPEPIARRDGALYGELAGKQAALVSFLPGKSRSIIANVHAASVGDALAKLHRASEGFVGTRANALSLAGWQALYAKLEGKLDSIQPGLEKLVAEELDYLSNAPTLFSSSLRRQGSLGTPPPASTAIPAASRMTELPSGVIHADLFPDNVFFDGDQVSGVIDFYFACTDALAYDVAITLNAWVFEPKFEFNPIKSKLLLTHYQKIRPFSENEIAGFSTLLRGAALRFLLTRSYDWLNHAPDAQVIPKNPLEYAAKLRFHQQVKSLSEYGF